MFKKLILIFFLFTTSLFAQKEIILEEGQEKYELFNDIVEIYTDSTNLLTINEIVIKKFSINLNNSFNYGYSNATHWCRIKIKNNSTQNWNFLIFASLLDKIEFYEFSSSNKMLKRVSGNLYPHSTREIDAPFYGFKLDLKTSESEIVYLSVSTVNHKQFGLYIEEENYLEKALARGMYPWFFYFGMLFMMVVYNLLFFISVKDKTYLYYVLYILSFGLFQYTIFGFGFQFLWPNAIWFNIRATPFFTGLSTIFIALFSYNFLNIKYLFPKLKPVFYFLIVQGILFCGSIFLKQSTLSNYIIGCFSFLNVVIMLVVGTIVWWEGYIPARNYMIAWAVMLLALALFILKTLEILPASPLNYLILPIGSLIEVVMLSFGLGSRINSIEKEKTNAQKEVVNQLKTNELVRSRIARDLHDDLGSTLSSINILSEFAKKENTDHPEKLPQLLNKISESTQKLQENLQDIVWTTQNSDNKIDNLLVRMRLFGGEILESKSIDYQIDIDKNISDLKINSDLQYDIFMIYKEAINNIVKYAEAKKVFIEFNLDFDNLLLKIRDDGKGFDINSEKSGNGLKNMKHRAENIGADLEILSEIGIGSSIKLSVPVPQ